jgi:GNAT superfamily N-acetyltransferase
MDTTAQAELALTSERLLFGQACPPQAARPGKALLVKPLLARAEPELRLRQIRSAANWAQYLQERIQIEAQYGVESHAAQAMVDAMRRRQATQAIAWYFLHNQKVIVGAIGLLTFEYASVRCGRLQDVDVFARFRGHGYGHQLLATIETHAFRRGLQHLVVGADQDDWPLQWYLKSGYQ